jgi:hypothetical protein
VVYQIDTPGLEDQAVTNDKIESGTIEINRLDSTLAGALVPVGGIIMWSGTLDQINGFPNWQLCDGSAISSGALSGTNTPNLTGRFVIGTDTYDTNDNRWEETITGNANQTGGSKDAIVVEHGHTVTVDSNTTGITIAAVGDHNHGYNGGNLKSLAGDAAGNDDYASGGGTTGGGGGHNHTLTDNGHTHTGSATDAGSSGTNANLPPYYALAYIIRIN